MKTQHYLLVHVPGTTSTIELSTDLRATDSVLFAGDRAYVATQGTGVMIFDPTTHARVDADGDATNGVSDIQLAHRAGQHWMAQTPF